jgi:hypothetical protein
MNDPLLDYRARLLERLEAVLPELADAIAAIPESRWHETSGPGGRSAHAVVAHLRDVEREAYLVRLRRLVAEDAPVFQSWTPPDWEINDYNPGEPLADILAEYAGLREAELQLLRPLSPAAWARAGRHTTLGRRTLQWWTERILEYAEDRLQVLHSLQ